LGILLLEPWCKFYFNVKKPTFDNLVILQQPPWSFVESPLQRYSPTLAQHTVSSLPPLSLFLRTDNMSGNILDCSKWEGGLDCEHRQSMRAFNNNLVLGRVDDWMSRDQHNNDLWLGKKGKHSSIFEKTLATWCASAADVTS